MGRLSNDSIRIDHCRIGSLESFARTLKMVMKDHCRIGSLENDVMNMSPDKADHCRIGSLEKNGRRCREGL